MWFSSIDQVEVKKLSYHQNISILASTKDWHLWLKVCFVLFYCFDIVFLHSEDSRVCQRLLLQTQQSHYLISGLPLMMILVLLSINLQSVLIFTFLLGVNIMVILIASMIYARNSNFWVVIKTDFSGCIKYTHSKHVSPKKNVDSDFRILLNMAFQQPFDIAVNWYWLVRKTIKCF